MKKIFLFLSLFSLLASAEARQKGLNFNDEKYGEVPEKAVLMRGEYKELPAAHSMKKFCPEPGNQGDYGTCVGWSSAYAARTIVEAMDEGLTSRTEITGRAFSPGFVYNLIKSNGDFECEYGSMIEDALEIMKNKGAVRFRSFSQDCPRNLPQSLFSEAEKHKIDDYARLFGTYEESEAKIQAVKKALSQNNPVVIGMIVPPSFTEARGVWIPQESPLMSYGGHAMCVIGYDDRAEGGSFEIMNSWGREWGNEGFIRIKYKDFHRFVKYGFEMIHFPKREPAKADLSGGIRVSLLEGGEMPVKLTGTPGRYKVSKPYTSGTKFRILISNNEPAYVYAFGSDLSGKSYQIFPHKKGVSPALTYKSNDIAIPDEDHHVKMDKNVGTDYLCVLYSKEALDIDRILAQTEAGTGDFYSRLQRVLGNKSVDPAGINYAADKVSFSAVSGGKSVVATVMEIEHR